VIEGVGTSKVTAVVGRSFYCSSIPLISFRSCVGEWILLIVLNHFDFPLFLLVIVLFLLKE